MSSSRQSSGFPFLPSVFWLSVVRISQLPCTSYMYRSAHPQCFPQRSNIRQRARIVKLLSMKLSAQSCQFLPITRRFRYSPELCSQSSLEYVLSIKLPKFHTHIKGHIKLHRMESEILILMLYVINVTLCKTIFIN
jgi:hypothetical protein